MTIDLQGRKDLGGELRPRESWETEADPVAEEFIARMGQASLEGGSFETETITVRWDEKSILASTRTKLSRGLGSSLAPVAGVARSRYGRGYRPMRERSEVRQAKESVTRQVKFAPDQPAQDSDRPMRIIHLAWIERAGRRFLLVEFRYASVRMGFATDPPPELQDVELESAQAYGEARLVAWEPAREAILVAFLYGAVPQRRPGIGLRAVGSAALPSEASTAPARYRESAYSLDPPRYLERRWPVVLGFVLPFLTLGSSMSVGVALLGAVLAAGMGALGWWLSSVFEIVEDSVPPGPMMLGLAGSSLLGVATYVRLTAGLDPVWELLQFFAILAYIGLTDRRVLVPAEWSHYPAKSVMAGCILVAYFATGEIWGLPPALALVGAGLAATLNFAFLTRVTIDLDQDEFLETETPSALESL